MMFDEYTLKKILSGEKCVTRRVVRNNNRPAIPKTIHKLKKDRSSKSYGQIQILGCKIDNLMNLSELDAKLEGFDSKEGYIKYFKNINNINSLNTKVWVITFKKV